MCEREKVDPTVVSRGLPVLLLLFVVVFLSVNSDLNWPPGSKLTYQSQ